MYSVKLGETYINKGLNKGLKVIPTEIDDSRRPVLVFFHPEDQPENQETMAAYRFKRAFRLAEKPLERKHPSQQAKPVGFRLYQEEIDMLEALSKVYGTQANALREAIRGEYAKNF